MFCSIRLVCRLQLFAGFPDTSPVCEAHIYSTHTIWMCGDTVEKQVHLHPVDLGLVFALEKMYCTAQEIVWYPQPLHVALDARNPEAVSACCFTYDHGCLAQEKHISSHQIIRNTMNQLVRKLLKSICGRPLGARHAAVLLARFLLDYAIDKRLHAQTMELKRINDAVIFPLACQLASNQILKSCIHSPLRLLRIPGTAHLWKCRHSLDSSCRGPRQSRRA